MAAEITAATLAVAQGLVALRRSDWVNGFAQGINVKVSVGDVRVEHDVKLKDFTSWLDAH